jgi:hypothetical protein
MWGSLLVLALLTTINPVRIGLVILVLSRPRPMTNLLAYWVGAVIISVLTLMVPLIAIHAFPTSSSFVESFADPAQNPAAQRTAIGIGVFLLAIGALLAVRTWVRSPSRGGRHSSRRLQAQAHAATKTLESTAPPAISRLLGEQQDPGSDGAADARPLLTRVRVAWRSGSPWIAFLIGVLVVPPLDGVLFGLAIIATSGTSLGVQLVAVVVFIAGVLAIEEAILISNMIAPSKTAAVLDRLHEWARTHHQKFVAGILIVVGASLVLRGLGGL